MSDDRLRVLLVAYACEPGRGSEPGAGWNSAVSLADKCSVWVVTRANNQQSIESELSRSPVPDLHFVYYDLPAWARFWKRKQRGVQLYSYLWQVFAAKPVRETVQRERIDVAQHVTFVKYWAPSAVRSAGVPYIWGPVGGGEPLPRQFWIHLSLRAFVYETLRLCARRIAEMDPLVRKTAMHCALALATTPETAARVKVLGAKEVQVLTDVALTESEMREMSAVARAQGGTAVRFVGIGRLLGWKAYDLIVRALATSHILDWTLMIAGDGPERSRLLRIAAQHGVADRVQLVGRVPRSEVPHFLASADVFVHPSLHDTGGWVVVEAMAAGLPVVGCDAGGTSLRITPECGFLATVDDYARTLRELTEACEILAGDGSLREQMGKSARREAVGTFFAPYRTQQVLALLRGVSGRTGE